MIEFMKMGLLAGWRSHITRLLFCIGMALIAAAWLSGTFSGRAPKTVAFDVGFSLIRLVVVFLTLFWIQELLIKDIERKTIIFSVAYPLPRWHYLVGRLLAVCALGTFTIAVLSFFLYCSVHTVMRGYSQSTPIYLGLGYLMPFVGLVLDIWVISAFTLLIAAVSETPMVPFFVGLFFSVAARGLGPTITTLNTTSFASDQLGPQLKPLIFVLSWLLPDLSRLDWRNVVSYGVWPETQLIVLTVIQALCYTVLMTLIAAWRFSKRELT